MPKGVRSWFSGSVRWLGEQRELLFHEGYSAVPIIA